MKKLFATENAVLRKRYPELITDLSYLKKKLTDINYQNFDNFNKNIRSHNELSHNFIVGAIDLLFHNNFYLLSFFYDMDNQSIQYNQTTITQFIDRTLSIISTTEELSFLNSLKEDEDIYSELKILSDFSNKYGGLVQILTINSGHIELNLSCIKDEELFNLFNLRKITNLISLHLPNISDRIISSVCKLKNLQYLYLENLNLHAVPNFLTCTDLVFLSLKSNNIVLSEDDIEILNNLVNLSSIDLSKNSIDDVSSISKLNNIKFLNISYNDLYPYNEIKFLISLEVIKIGPIPPDDQIYFDKQFHIINDQKFSVVEWNNFQNINNLRDYFDLQGDSSVLSISKRE